MFAGGRRNGVGLCAAVRFFFKFFKNEATDAMAASGWGGCDLTMVMVARLSCAAGVCKAQMGNQKERWMGWDGELVSLMVSTGGFVS